MDYIVNVILDKFYVYFSLRSQLGIKFYYKKTVWWFTDRKHFQRILEAFVGHLKLSLHKCLTTVLISTGLKPHFGITCDKSTPGRETNHAIMVLLCVNGVRKAVPVGAPKVYDATDNRIHGGLAENLAEQLVRSLTDFTLSGDEILHQLMGNKLYILLVDTDC